MTAVYQCPSVLRKSYRPRKKALLMLKQAGSLVRSDESNHDAVLLQYYFCTVAQEKTNWTFCMMYVHIAALLPATV